MTPADLPLPVGFAERFWAKVQRSAGCWLWQASFSPNGYGKVGFHHKMRNYTLPAHRVAYLLTYSEIPDGLEVCHHCDNRACVRPDHLFTGTSHDNHMDMAAKGRGTRKEVHAPPKKRPRLSHEEWLSRQIHGAQHYKARLDEGQVQAIRQRCAAGESQRALAREFGVSNGAIAHIVHRRSWKHVPE